MKSYSYTQEITDIHTIFITPLDSQAIGSTYIKTQKSVYSEEEFQNIKNILDNINKIENYIYLFSSDIVYFEDNGRISKIQNEKEEKIALGSIKIDMKETIKNEKITINFIFHINFDSSIELKK